MTPKTSEHKTCIVNVTEVPSSCMTKINLHKIPYQTYNIANMLLSILSICKH